MIHRADAASRLAVRLYGKSVRCAVLCKIRVWP